MYIFSVERDLDHKALFLDIFDELVAGTFFGKKIDLLIFSLRISFGISFLDVKQVSFLIPQRCEPLKEWVAAGVKRR